MRAILLAMLLAATAAAQTDDPIRAAVARLSLDQYKADVKGLAQFGDRRSGTKRNREALDWIEEQLRSYGYTNVQRLRYQSGNDTLEDIYATKSGTTTPGEMYLVTAHMDGRGGGEAADDDASGCAVVLEIARVLATVNTNRSVRFIFWNNEEFGMDGSGTYASQRAKLQGSPEEPKWLGIIQHDMMMYDHGFPPGPDQSPNADINVNYAMGSKLNPGSAALAHAIEGAGRTYATDYPVTVGTAMAGTDSIMFMDAIPSVSVREAERIAGIVRGSNPHHHEATDKIENYSEADFRLGFTSAKLTLAALGQLAGIWLR